MLETFVTLLTAHLFADFPFQADWMVAKKKQIKILMTHVLILAVVVSLLIGNISQSGIAILVVTILSHLAIDAVKAYKLNDNAKTFSIDQACHLGVIATLAWLYPGVVQNGMWQSVLVEHLPWFFIVMTLVSGFLLVIPVGGILIGKLIEPISQEIRESPIVLPSETGQKSATATTTPPNAGYPFEGLKNGGKYIGWLERFLTLMLILIGQPTGIGFLIAAKSILRFGEIKEARDRKLAEYIIIGTFLSFGWALSIAVVTKEGVDHWSPKKEKPVEKIQVILEDKKIQQGIQQLAPAQAPTPQAPTPQAPSPQAPSPQAPSPQAPSPQAPSPQAPTPQVPSTSAIATPPTTSAPTQPNNTPPTP